MGGRRRGGGAGQGTWHQVLSWGPFGKGKAAAHVKAQLPITYLRKAPATPRPNRSSRGLDWSPTLEAGTGFKAGGITAVWRAPQPMGPEEERSWRIDFVQAPTAPNVSTTLLK
jgi:hypothetical protein